MNKERCIFHFVIWLVVWSLASVVTATNDAMKTPALVVSIVLLTNWTLTGNKNRPVVS